METGKERIEELKQKYGAKAIDNAVRMHAHDVPGSVDWADELDEHYTKRWLDSVYAGMPCFVRFVAILERALEEQGRIKALTETQLLLAA